MQRQHRTMTEEAAQMAPSTQMALQGKFNRKTQMTMAAPTKARLTAQMRW